jgi:hypothetical protein
MPQSAWGRTGESPRSFGALPLGWRGRDVLLPVAHDEAFWLSFDPADAETSSAIRIAVSATTLRDAVSGGDWSSKMQIRPQNYVVCPPQRAINGVAEVDRPFRPFARVTLMPEFFQCCALDLYAIPPLRRMAPQQPTRPIGLQPHPLSSCGPIGIAQNRSGAAEILPDLLGPAAWDVARIARVRVRLVSPECFRAETGIASVPLSPESHYRGWLLP